MNTTSEMEPEKGSEWSDEEFYARMVQDTGTEVDGQKDTTSSGSESEDNIPLAELRKRQHVRHKKPVKRKLIPESDADIDISDDSAGDKTYNLSADEINSTDTSETDSVLCSKVRKKRKSVKLSRDKQWQKKITRVGTGKKRIYVQRNKQNTILKRLQEKIKVLRKKREVKGISDVQKAKTISKRMQSVKTIIATCHNNRLDTLLAGNELSRIPVKADGNCLFAAVKRSCPFEELSNKSVDQLREETCQHMLDNQENYVHFFNNPQEFEEGVEYLRISGNWKGTVADCLPLAFSNAYKCILRIYSSAINTPVYEVIPGASEQSDSALHVISVAYIAIRNEEHYDATAPLHRDATATLPQQTKKSDVPAPRSPERHQNEPTDQWTPHKAADFQSPKKKHSSRKRMKNEDAWKRNVRKNSKLTGKQYVSETGKVMKSKGVKPRNCGTCRFKCNEHFSDEHRQDVFDCFYSLGSYERQRDFICDMILRQDLGRKGKGKKSHAKKYFLSCGQRRERVCKDFFKATLDISNKLIAYTIERKEHGTFNGKDNRGQQPSANKTSDQGQKVIHDHINSFPKMESHYSRKDSRKQYLSHDLNIKKMYTLYCEECKRKGLTAVKIGKYRKEFCEKFNLSFFKPKKDQCSICARFEHHRENDTLSDQIKEDYEAHQQSKREAREQKEKDKVKAKQNNDVYTATFDLQAVLTTPCSLVSEMYYARKLCCYNLTFFSLSDKQVCCHLWNETQGKRGSCEIATCLLKNTESVCSSNRNLKEINYYSDSCSGQNRNQYVTASYLYAMSKLSQLERINHKFLQSGHTQMECDSVHSSIEVAKKCTNVYVPSQWSTIVCLARKSKPYIAIPLKYDQILDFKSFVKNQSLKFQMSVDGRKVNWLQVKWIQVRRENPRSVFVNYTYDASAFLEINTQPGVLRRKGRIQSWPKCDADVDHCYDTKLPISVMKKNDLVNLCKRGIVPEDFHQYYEMLQVSKSLKDKLPAPSMDEDSDGDSD